MSIALFGILLAMGATQPLDLDAPTRAFLAAPSFKLEQEGVADPCAGPLATALSFSFDDQGGGSFRFDGATANGEFTVTQAHQERGRVVMVIADPADGTQTKTLGFDRVGDNDLQVVDRKTLFFGPGSFSLERNARFRRCETPPR